MKHMRGGLQLPHSGAHRFREDVADGGVQQAVLNHGGGTEAGHREVLHARVAAVSLYCSGADCACVGRGDRGRSARIARNPHSTQQQLVVPARSADRGVDWLRSSADYVASFSVPSRVEVALPQPTLRLVGNARL